MRNPPVCGFFIASDREKTMLTTILPQGAERSLMILGGTVGGFLSFAFGDIGPLFMWLIIFVCIDFLTGTLASIVRGTWTSKQSGIGVIKKVLYFCIVALAHGLDVVFSSLIHVEILQSIVICAYAAGEVGSILENIEACGFGSVIPSGIRRLIKALNERVENAVDDFEGGKK